MMMSMNVEREKKDGIHLCKEHRLQGCRNRLHTNDSGSAVPLFGSDRLPTNEIGFAVPLFGSDALDYLLMR